jgi:hypothetical protein
MNIVEPSPEDVTLRAAMDLAGVSDKTLRRAVHAGELPRHYIQTPRGLQLVFRRADLERWMAAHTRRRRVVVPPPAPPVIHAAVRDAVLPLIAVLDRAQAAMAAVFRQLERHEQQLASARTTIDRLIAQLADADGAVAKAAPEATDDRSELTATASGPLPS